MTKAARQKSRRLKRTVRKTLGTLFLVSALIIAAIPVDGLRAAEENEIMPLANYGGNSIESLTSNLIPQMTKGGGGTPATKIYTSTDRLIQFAYLDDGDGYSAVVVGYNGGYLENGSLDFTGTVDAYGQYRINDASGHNYAAVGQQGNFLFYRERVERTYTAAADVGLNPDAYMQKVTYDPAHPEQDSFIKELRRTVDPATQKVTSLTVLVETGAPQPCYIETYDNWSDAKILDEELYYDVQDPTGLNPNDGHTPQYELVGNDSRRHRIKNAKIKYISNQYITTDSNGKWQPADAVNESTKDMGIFANKNNVKSLTVSKEFKGIGDYAFYRSGLTEINLENGLLCVGNGAFESCNSLTTVNFDLECNLRTLGARAFRNCPVLSKFVLPSGVSQIGDFAFEGCMAITEIDLCSGREASSLAELGQGVFRGCQSLQSLTFPNACDDEVYISSFAGCSSLRWISARNKDLKFLEDGVLPYDAFKAQVTDEFYFEGLGTYPATWNFETTPEAGWDSQVHRIAYEQNFAFSYLKYEGEGENGRYVKQDHYELTVNAGTTGKNTFVVNHSNVLERYTPTGTVSELAIPRKIGPYSVATIDAGVFEYRCNLETVSLPETVGTVKANAFRGCHNLTNVIFESGNTVIEPNAFKTQEYIGDHAAGCGGVATDGSNAPVKELHFTGPISASSRPFNYAMSSEGRYNAASQRESYIVYYSGLPQNLEVKYDPEAVNPNTGARGMSVLENFPSLTTLANGTYNDSSYAYLPSDYAAAASAAVAAYKSGGSLSENQIQMIDAAMNIQIPEGVQAIREGLFYDRGLENAGQLIGSSASSGMTVTAESIVKVDTGTELKGGSVSGGNAADGADPERVTGIVEGTGTFANCEYLTSVTLNNVESNPVTVGDHAFWNCKRLTGASMANVDELGVRPFAGCEELSNVNFQNSPKYVCENSIIYGLGEGGSKTSVIECLEGRSSKYVNAEELAGVQTLAPEAFMGTGLRSVDLTATMLTEAPDRAFADTPRMQDILLPDTCRSYGKFVFDGTGATRISMPYEGSLILTDDSFKGLNPDDTAIGCVEGSFIYDWATKNGFEVVPPNLGERTYKVTFRDYENGLLITVQEDQVVAGKYATPPAPKGREGLAFMGWQAEPDNKIYNGPFEVTNDVICTAMYDIAPPDYNKLTVSFRDEANNLLRDVYVNAGEDVSSSDIPVPPDKEGYTFIGWDRPLTNVTESFTTYPQYRAVAGDECVVRYFVDGSLYFSTVVKTGQNAPDITVTGRPNVTWVPALTNITKDTDFTAIFEEPTPTPPGSTPTPTPTPPANTGSGNTGSSNTAPRLHTLTVQNGTGSGSYVAGTQIIVNANNPARGQSFSSWTVSPSTTVTTDKSLSSMIITMPDYDVAVIANYRASNSTSTSTGTSNNTNSNRPGGSTGNLTGGTTVVIDKNGLSNTGVVSATVNGSSDNFTIKITEDSAASEAVLKALMAEYGSLDNIKYFPMDISLYDASGTRKITDTTGLKISITLPLPDSLREYAGNNMVAGVVNDRLDKLSPRFTTINGVPCVTFSAEHFSPYVIYADLGNLASNPGSDKTPQTGDGIHPKWFLSIGLACLSFIMFMQKDSRTKKKQKVRVRA